MFELKYDDKRPFPTDYPRVRIAADIEVCSPLGLRLKGSADDESRPFDLDGVVEVVDGRFAITELNLSRVEGGPPINAGHLAKIRIWDFLNGSVFVSNSMLFITDYHAGKEFVAQATGSEAWNQQLQKLLDLESARNDLAGLARFYRITRLGFYDPTETLASALGVNSSTIRRWLAEAVKCGELRQEERRK
jgi:hypothetical protein